MEEVMVKEVYTQHDQLFSALIEDSLQAVLLLMPDGTIVYSNAAARHLTGARWQEIEKRRLFHLLHPQDSERIQAVLADLLDRPGGRVSVSVRLRQQRDAWRWIEGSISNRLHDRRVRALVFQFLDITERKYTEERLRRAEEERSFLLAREQTARERLYDLFMQAPANIAIVQGPEHRFELANPRFLRTIGRSDVLGKSAKDVIAEIAVQGYERLMDDVYTSGKPFIGIEMPVRIDRRGDGQVEEGFFNFVYQPFLNAQGEVEGVMIHGVEVTEQVVARRRIEELVAELQTERAALRQAQEEATRQARQLSAIFETMTDAIIVCDSEGKIVQTNSTFRTFAGPEDVSAFDVTGKTSLPAWMVPYDADGDPMVLEQWPLRRLLQGERLSGSRTVDMRVSLPNGEWLTLNVSGAPMYNEEGQIVGAVAVLRNVTERYRLEQRLSYSEHKLRSLVEANILGVAVVGAEGKVYEANGRLAKMMGYSREELLAEEFHWQHLDPAQLSGEEEELARRLVSEGNLQPYERTYLRKDGNRFPALVAATMIDQERQRALLVLLDISDRQAAEQRKQEFLSMVSHELRSPLTGIVGYLDLVQFHLQQIPRQLSAQVDDLLDRIEYLLAQVERQTRIENRLIEALLDVSRMEQHTFKLSLAPCNLLDIVKEVVTSQQQGAQARRIILQLPEQVAVPVTADADRVGQVLTNYLTNALKYSPADREVQVGLELVEGQARVYVRDQGAGLTDEQQQRIWERFYRAGTPTTHRAEGGELGLGLYIVKIIVEQHHGQVGVESRPGEGSTFWFTLPLA